jgi:hypothetical protein
VTAIAVRLGARVRPAPIAWLAALGGAAAVRGLRLHSGLVYPDAYQYLLMARGLAEHARPVTRLGPGGDLFVPNADAAAKPLFPGLIALVHAFGVPWTDAGRAVTVAAAALVVVLCAALARAVTGSTLAAAAAGVCCLLSPSLGYWAGFLGPDPVAQALALGAALALVSRAPTLGGALAGAAAATRPELLVLALAGGALAVARPQTRPAAIRAAVTGAAVLACVHLALRSPLSLPPQHLALVAVLGTAAAVAATLLSSVVKLVAPLAILGGLVFVAGSSGAEALARSDGPLLALAAACLLLAWATPRYRTAASAVAGCGLLLAAVYWAKNPHLERYLSGLVPIAALVVALGVAALPAHRRALGLTVVAAAIAVTLVVTPKRDVGPDFFATLAPALPVRAGEPLVTAAPDAYAAFSCRTSP